MKLTAKTTIDAGAAAAETAFYTCSSFLNLEAKTTAAAAYYA